MKLSRSFGGVLLVSGTAIGGGMLALPISTGLAGFFPSMAILFLFWVYMTITGFLFLEVNLWLKEDTNIVTMAQHTLGVIGKIISWMVYLFLLYALTTAYLAGCGSLLINSLSSWLHYTLPAWVGPLPFLFLFGSCVYLGTKPVDYINRILMISLIVIYGVIQGTFSSHIQPDFLLETHWRALLPASAVVVTSFGYHIIIPTLAKYLDYNVAKLKKTLLIGGILPLIIYIFWVLVILGIIPMKADGGLTTIAKEQNPEISMIQALQIHLSVSWISSLMRAFSYFAILTSFLGVSISLVDFLLDGLKMQRRASNRLVAAILTFLPPFLITLINPSVFLQALKYAGIFVAILLGMLPCAMVWMGRYKLKAMGSYKVCGGKTLLITVFTFSVLIVIIDILDQTGILQKVITF